MLKMRTIARALLLAAAKPALAGTVSVTNPADNGPGNCTNGCTLRDAIATANSGDTIDFSIALPSTIVLSAGELLFPTSVHIVGPGAGLLAVSAANNTRVLNISDGSNVSVSGLTLRDGHVSGNSGGNGDTGQPGGTGFPAAGGCIYVHDGARLTLARVAVTSCTASGGRGGNGGKGLVDPGQTGSQGGDGGTGGAALGAIYSAGDLTIVQSSVTGCTLEAGGGGYGGGIGYGGLRYNVGAGGSGGAAYGGGVYASAGTLLVSNSTISNCMLSGGSGESAPYLGYPYGYLKNVAGSGGNASGGSVFVGANVTAAVVEFSTLSGNTVSGGNGGSYPFQAPNGSVIAEALDSKAPLSIKSSIVASVGAAADCAGLINSEGGNFDQNSTCTGFSVHGTVANALTPLAANAGGTFSLRPRFGGAVIDAATDCALLDQSASIEDQHETLRPQGPACDLGAIEADYMFVSGFD